MDSLSLAGRRRSGALVLVFLLAALAVAGYAAPSATGQDQNQNKGQGNGPSGVTRGNAQSACRGKYEVQVDGRVHGCTHGYDPLPAGVSNARDPRVNPRDGQTAPNTPGAATSPGTAAATANSTACIGDGVSGPRVQVLYVFPPGGDNSAATIPSIKAWAGNVDAVFNNSAATTGGTRRVRFVTDASCQVVVSTAAVSTAALNNFGLMINALETAGFTRSDRKYLVWADWSGAGICGIGEIFPDDQIGAANLNNRGGMWGRTDRPCWGRTESTEAHELMHMLGGVQTSAPHATSFNHCTDDYDRMCYSDGSGFPLNTICASSAMEAQFDCNKDDYFYAGSPPAGNYLASHWNSASSIYLEAGTLPPPTGVTLSVSPTTVAAGQSVNVTWAGVNPPTNLDFIGLYPSSGTADSDTGRRVAWQWTTGAISGTIPFTIPAGTPAGNQYEFRIFYNNSFARMATSDRLTVQAPAGATISGAPNPVSAGQTLNATWGGIATPTTLDWIGLYPTGAADNSPTRITYRFTNGAAGWTLPVTVPSATPTGNYELRLFANNSYTKLATSGAISVQGAPATTVSGSPSAVVAGQSLQVDWANIAAPATYDWIGLYPVGATDNSPARVWFFFTNAMASGSRAMTIPAATPAGNYELRLFANNSYTRLAVSGPRSIQAAPPPSISASPVPATAGQNVNAGWANIAAPTTYDWIGLYPVGATDNSPTRVTFRFTNGVAGGTLQMAIPSSTAAGNYELRLFSNNSYSKLATSAVFAIQAAAAPTVTGTPNPVLRGQALNVSWASIAAPTTYDWVGLYPAGAPDNSPARVWFFFTNAMTTGVTAMTVPAGIAAGAYELRLFANNSYTRLANSALTVQ